MKLRSALYLRRSWTSASTIRELPLWVASRLSRTCKVWVGQKVTGKTYVFQSDV